jgi:hypothetical protein
MNQAIKNHEQNLWQFIDITTRYSIDMMFDHWQKIKKMGKFPFIDYQFENRHKFFHAFRDALSTEFKERDWKAFEIDLTDRFLSMIRQYYDWYSEHEEETKKFEPYNFYRLMIEVMQATEHEINKYFQTPKEVKQPAKLEDIIQKQKLEKLVKSLEKHGFVNIQNKVSYWKGQPIEFAAMVEVCRTLIVEPPYRDNAKLLYKAWNGYFKYSTKEKRDKDGLLYIVGYNYFKPAWIKDLFSKFDTKYTPKFDFIKEIFNTE